MNNHVTSLELSKKLKKLGVKQESLFVWSTQDKPEIGVKPYVTHTFGMGDDKIGFVCNQHISAYLSSELGEVFKKLGSEYIVNTVWSINQWVCELEKIETLRKRQHIIWGQSEVEVKSEMLEYLLTNNLIAL